MSKHDFYAELSKQIKEIASLVENTWEEIWSNREIRLKEKQSKFEELFNKEVRPRILKTHKLINLNENKEITYYQIFAILKTLDCNIAHLSSFAKTLRRNVGSKDYYPKLPEDLAKKSIKICFYRETIK